MAEPEPDLTPEQLAALRPPAKLTPSEIEVYEGKLTELRERIAEVEAENAALKQPKVPEKKKSFLSDFSPI